MEYDRIVDVFNKGTCTYCAKRFPKDILLSAMYDDAPHLERKYCPSCLEEVQPHFKKKAMKRRPIDK